MTSVDQSVETTTLTTVVSHVPSTEPVPERPPEGQVFEYQLTCVTCDSRRAAISPTNNPLLSLLQTPVHA